MYKKLFIALTVIAAMTLLLAGCAIVDTATISNGPTVHMSGANFVQSSITLHKGDMLNLVDDAPSPHIIVNGSWINGTAKPSIESGAPTVNKSFNGNLKERARLNSLWILGIEPASMSDKVECET